MPNYQYECLYCRKEWTEYLSYDENPSMCPYCEQKEFKKIYSFSTTNKTSEVSNQKAGSKTRQFIEESRKDLEEQKEAMRGK